MRHPQRQSLPPRGLTLPRACAASRAVLDLIAESRCLGCDCASPASLCAECAAELEAPLRALPTRHTLLTHAVALGAYAGPIGTLVRRAKFQHDPHWRDLILFYEYFHGDTGAGLGASHQTGWTGVVAKLIHQHAEYALQGRQHRRSGVDGQLR